MFPLLIIVINGVPLRHDSIKDYLRSFIALNCYSFAIYMSTVRICFIVSKDTLQESENNSKKASKDRKDDNELIASIYCTQN